MSSVQLVQHNFIHQEICCLHTILSESSMEFMPLDHSSEILMYFSLHVDCRYTSFHIIMIHEFI